MYKYSKKCRKQGARREYGDHIIHRDFAGVFCGDDFHRGAQQPQFEVCAGLCVGGQISRTVADGVCIRD